MPATRPPEVRQKSRATNLPTPAPNPELAASALPKAAPPARELTPLQETLLQGCADAILNGTNERLLNDLLWAIGKHNFRRKHETLHDQPDAGVPWVQRLIADWKRQIRGCWPAKGEEASANRVESTSVSEQLRLTVKTEIPVFMDRFIADASPEELRLMRDVLRDRDNETWLGPDAPEVPLGYCFAQQLDKPTRYLMIPDERRRELVRQYLALLEERKWDEVDSDTR